MSGVLEQQVVSIQAQTLIDSDQTGRMMLHRHIITVVVRDTPATMLGGQTA
ncbi:MAG: hypothetical protein HC876_09855 [Chloroflexaceae bacterium]|nr:hypothetical protein [Chloroflexaceae bacterium]